MLCAKWGRSVALVSWIKNTNGCPLINWSCLCFLGEIFSCLPTSAACACTRARACVCVCARARVLGTYTHT